MTEDIRHIEFIASKSKDFIDRQISSYRQKQANAASIMAIISLFIPFFLTGLDEASFIIRIFSIVPVAFFVFSIFSLLEVLKSKPLDQGFHTNKFQELVNADYKKVLLYEIGANQSSFIDNEKKVNNANRIFMRGVKVTTIAVAISIVLLLVSKFVKPVKVDSPLKVKIIS